MYFGAVSVYTMPISTKQQNRAQTFVSVFLALCLKWILLGSGKVYIVKANICVDEFNVCDVGNFQPWNFRNTSNFTYNDHFGRKYNHDTLFDVLLFFEIISVLTIQKTRVTRHLKAEVSNLPCGTQITPPNKNVVFFKSFPHGTQILKLVHGCCLANIYIFGA